VRGAALPNLRRPLASAGIAAGLVLFALAFALLTRDQPTLALAVPAVLATAVLCARWPAAAVTSMLFLGGAYGSLQAFGILTAGPVVDLLMAALMVSVIIGHAINGRREPWWIWPGVAILLLYVGITFLETATAASIGIGIKSFRYTAWYMLVIPLLALAGWRLGVYLRISRALIATALLVAGYAVLRQVIGPAASEAQLAQQSAGAFNTIGGDLALIGSFPNRHGLAFWVTCAAPFCLAAAMIDRRIPWKLAAAAAVGLCLIAAYATDVRVAIPALIAGGATVVILNQLSAGARGTALAQTVSVVAVAALVGSVLFAAVVGPDSSRYGALLSPSGDQSYEQHVYKWGAALDEMDGHPFGNGLGTAGRIAEQGLGPYVTAATYAIDSSYLKIAFEQGFPLLAIFLAAMIALLVGLARRAIRARSPGVRALSIGATGTLVAALVMFVTGQYMEDVSALIVWIPVGAAIGALGAERASAEAASPAG
jgi:hypothetical protein